MRFIFLLALFFGCLPAHAQVLTSLDANVLSLNNCKTEIVTSDGTTTFANEFGVEPNYIKATQFNGIVGFTTDVPDSVLCGFTDSQITCSVAPGYDVSPTDFITVRYCRDVPVGSSYAEIGTTNTFTEFQNFTKNVGINNNNPSPFGTFYPALQGAGAASFVVGAKSNTLDLVANGYSGNDFQWKYTSPGQKAATVRIDAPSGDIFFLNTDTTSTAAGDNISWSNRMVITSDGKVGIDTTNPLSEFSIGEPSPVKDRQIRQYLGGTGADINLVSQGSGNRDISLFYRGHSTAGTDLVGRITSDLTGRTIGLVDGSDARLKENFREAKSEISKLNKVNLLTYNWKDDAEKKKYLGVLAQELYKLYPEAVTKGDDAEEFGEDSKIWGVDKKELILPLLKGFQELSAKLDKICSMHDLACEEN